MTITDLAVRAALSFVTIVAIVGSLYLFVRGFVNMILKARRDLIGRMVDRGLSLNFDPVSQLWTVQRTILRQNPRRMVLVQLGSSAHWDMAVKTALEIEPQALGEALVNDDARIKFEGTPGGYTGL